MMRAAKITSARRVFGSTKACCLSATLACFVACNKPAERPAPRPTPATPIERELQLARRSLAKNIFVISRNDNAELTSEDRAFIRQNLPLDRVYTGITDDRRQIVITMHIDFPAENMAAIRARYNVAQVQT